MRVSTIVFLLLFLGLFGHVKRRAMLCEASKPSCPVEQREQSPELAAVKGLERELKTADQQCKEIDCSIRNIEKSVRGLEELVRKAEKDYADACRKRMDSRIVSIRKKNVESMRSELKQVLEGHRELTVQREKIEASRTALLAKIQLARAGVNVTPDKKPAPDLNEWERPSPVDALSEMAVYTSH